MVLPDIDKVPVIKLANGSKKCDWQQQHEEYLYKYASATNEELSEKLGVSVSSVKRKKTSMHLTKNSRVNGERKHEKAEEKATQKKVEQLSSVVTEVKDADSSVLWLMRQSTGKDFNGRTLTNEDRVNVDGLKQASEYPNANQNMWVRMRTEESEEQRRMEEQQRDEEETRRKSRINRIIANERKKLRDMGKYSPMVEMDLYLQAVARYNLEEAQREVDRQGRTELVTDGKGQKTRVATAASQNFDKAFNRLGVANQKLSTNLQKWDRLTGADDEGPTEADRMNDVISKLLADDNLPNQINK